MSPVTMDEAFAIALRSALVEHVRTPTRVAWWQRQWRVPVIAVIGLGLAGGGVASATGHLILPGGDDVSRLAAPVTGEHIGPAVVELGDPPAGADHIEIEFTCLSAGSFTFADGASASCSSADAASDRPSVVTFRLPLTKGQHTTTVDTSSGARWRLSVTYSSVHTTEWAVNQSGQTFGVSNAKGDPDLMGIVASNGRTGYVERTGLNPPTPTSPTEALAWQNGQHEVVQLPVYESDGKTVIGFFPVEQSVLARHR